MAMVYRLTPRAGAPGLGAAVEAFLATIGNANTAKAWEIALRALAAELGEHAALAELGGEAGADRVVGWFTARWGGAAAATFNARLDALGSACGWWRDQGWLAGDPLRRIRRRARTPDRTRALARAEVETLLTQPGQLALDPPMPQVGFSRAIRTISALTGRRVPGRPGRRRSVKGHTAPRAGDASARSSQV